MRILELKVYNFRCFYSKKMEFDAGVNVIVGKNASGKTSVLEAINFLSLTKSFRTNYDSELIGSNACELAVNGIVLEGMLKDKLCVVKQSKGKATFINDNKCERISEYLGKLISVSCSNYDFVNLVGNSSERRSIIEPIICQISKFYLTACNLYKKLLNDRNALLKRLYVENNNKERDTLEIVTKQLIDCASQIVKIRKQTIEEINVILKEKYALFSDENETFEIVYKPSVEIDQMKEKLEESLGEDIKKGYTSFGPQRDDYIFIINNKNIIYQASQGQQKSALLCTKIALAELIIKLKKITPILLLDDVFSDLDKTRQNKLFKMINPNMQVIMSAPSLAEINQGLLDGINVINLQEMGC